MTISDPEEILRKARALLRQTSSTAQKDTIGISRNISSNISSIETLNSQEFLDTSENFRVEESSGTATCEDLIPGDSIEELWLCEGIIPDKIKRGHQKHLLQTQRISSEKQELYKGKLLEQQGHLDQICL